MMYIHYCQKCHHTHILNGHQTHCPNCNNSLHELSISYLEYVELDADSRNMLIIKLENEFSAS